MTQYTQSAFSQPASSSRQDAWDWYENPYHAGYHYPTVSEWYAVDRNNRNHDLARAATPRREWRMDRVWAWFLSPLKAG
jgi:hypothetical protein